MMTIFKKPIKATLCTLIFLLAFTTYSLGQISISPTSLFFDNQQRFSSLTISNGGQQAQEVSISTEFGYVANNDKGITIVSDSALAKKKSIEDWIKVFPKNFTLQSQQRQTVRFVVRPPNNLPPGGYWARVRIQSNPVSPPIESVEEGEIGAQVNLVVNQVISAHYHTQSAQTGIEVTGINFTQVDSTQKGTIAVSMSKKGNAPFIGTISLRVTNNKAETVYESSTTNAVYTEITRYFSMDLSDIKPGTYTISGTVSSERQDISQDNLLQIEPVTFEKQITIE